MSTLRQQVFIEAPGILAPGISDWQQFIANGLKPVGDELPKLVAERLPRAERRRATKITRLAFMAGEQSAAASAIPVEQLANIFVSSCSSTDIVDSVCMQLCDDPMLVSPTQFHNSVHNAPVGYWSIATGSKMPSSSISGYDHSFAAGLLDAYSQVLTERIPAMLIAADLPVAGRLASFRDTSIAFSSSFVLTPVQTDASIASLSVALSNDGSETTLEEPLNTLRLSNPAARSLPLLLQLANAEGGAGTVSFTLNGCQLIATLSPLAS